MFTDRLGLMFEVQVSLHRVALDRSMSATEQQSLFVGALQYWPWPRLWIKGGLGLAYVDLVDEPVAFPYPATGMGVLAGAGYELVSTSRFALELELRLAAGLYQISDGGLMFYSLATDAVTSGTLGLGVNWY